METYWLKRKYSSIHWAIYFVFLGFVFFLALKHFTLRFNCSSFIPAVQAVILYLQQDLELLWGLVDQLDQEDPEHNTQIKEPSLFNVRRNSMWATPRLKDREKLCNANTLITAGPNRQFFPLRTCSPLSALLPFWPGSPTSPWEEEKHAHLTILDQLPTLDWVWVSLDYDVDVDVKPVFLNLGVGAPYVVAWNLNNVAWNVWLLIKINTNYFFTLIFLPGFKSLCSYIFSPLWKYILKSGLFKYLS